MDLQSLFGDLFGGVQQLIQNVVAFVNDIIGQVLAIFGVSL